MIHYRIKVVGKVQGVFYRASAQNAAKALGVNGWVKNESDGSVLISAEGTASQLKAFVDWCNQGPARAQVTHVSSTELKPEGFEGFRILY